jgi:predicted nucleotidyltransferase
MNVDQLLQSKRLEIIQIASKYVTCNVRVFGSVVRGDSRPDSDIDFLINLEDKRSLLDLGWLMCELQTLLGRSVDIVTEAGLRERLRSQVLKEARLL